MEEKMHIRSFGDAVANALELADQFRHAQTAVLLDDAGLVIDMTVFARRSHDEDDALDWAMCCLLNHDRPTRMVLISVVERNVREAREDDITKFNLARQVFGAKDCALLDWIQCDGVNVRSLAFTTGAGTWDETGKPVTSVDAS
jgi:hypothetical protein